MKTGLQWWTVVLVAVFGAAGCSNKGSGGGSDGGVAGAPGAPTAVSGVGSAGAIAVSWTPPKDPGSSALTGYTVTVNPGAVTVSVDAKTTTATVDKLVGGQTFSVSVVAKNAKGAGPAGTAEVKLLCTLCGFGGAPLIEVEGSPNAVAWGDFNGDGKPDLAIATATGNSLSIQLSNGDGSFKSLGLVATVYNTVAVQSLDLNGDGKQDLVVAGGSIVVLLGKGDGTFERLTDITLGLGSAAGSLALTDLNGDGKVDLLVPYYEHLGIQLGQGDGTFQAATAIAIPGMASSILVADFNGDGKSDVVLGSPGYSVTLNLGNGDGTFQATSVIAGTLYSVGLIATDQNADGKLDLMLTLDNGIVTYAGNGAGAFTAPAVMVGPAGISAQLADVDGDGKQDLVLVNAGGSSALWLPGTPSGFTLTALHPLPTGNNPRGFAVTEQNGHALLAVANAGSGSVNVVAFGAAGTLPTPLLDTGFILGIAAGDLNGDGKLDVVDVVQPTGYTPPLGYSVTLGNGDGTFQPPQKLTDVNRGSTLLLADVNGDGKLDLVTGRYSDVAFYAGKGDGTFEPAISFGSTNASTDVALADMDGDGKLDLVISTYDSVAGKVGFNHGNGDGTFTAPVFSPSGPMNDRLRAVDLNGDGHPDVVLSHTNGNISVQLNKGNGTFAAPVDYPAEDGRLAFTTGDLDGDGLADVMVTRPGNQSITVFKGKGDGTLESPVDHAVGHSPSAVLVADLNLDGKMDLVSADSSDNAITVLFGKEGGGLQRPVRYQGASKGQSLVAGDFDSDGKVDLLAGAGSVVGFNASLGLSFLHGSCFQ